MQNPRQKPYYSEQPTMWSYLQQNSNILSHGLQVLVEGRNTCTRQHLGYCWKHKYHLLLLLLSNLNNRSCWTSHFKNCVPLISNIVTTNGGKFPATLLNFLSRIFISLAIKNLPLEWSSHYFLSPNVLISKPVVKSQTPPPQLDPTAKQ